MWSILAEVNLEQNTGTDKVAAEEAAAEAELRYAKAVAMCIRTEAKAAQPPSEGHHEEKPREETTTKGSQMEKGGSKKDRSKESSQKGGKKSKKEALSAEQLAMLQVEHEQLQTCYQALRREVEQKQDVVDHIQAERKHALLKIMAEQMDVEIKQQRAAFRKEIDAAETTLRILCGQAPQQQHLTRLGVSPRVLPPLAATDACGPQPNAQRLPALRHAPAGHGSPPAARVGGGLQVPLEKPHFVSPRRTPRTARPYMSLAMSAPKSAKGSTPAVPRIPGWALSSEFRDALVPDTSVLRRSPRIDAEHRHGHLAQPIDVWCVKNVASGYFSESATAVE